MHSIVTKLFCLQPEPSLVSTTFQLVSSLCFSSITTLTHHVNHFTDIHMDLLCCSSYNDRITESQGWEGISRDPQDPHC